MRNDFYVGCYNDPNNLAHYGILGMHWGIRRYQNSNGSLTSEGKNRYKKKGGLIKAKKPKTKKPRREDISKLSDQELRAKLNRMQMERQYKQMTESDVEKGKKFAVKILKSAVTPMLVGATTAYILSGKQFVKAGAKGFNRALTDAYMKRLARRIF